LKKISFQNSDYR